MLSPVYAFSTRASGNMSLSYGDTARALDNRRDFLGGLGIDYHSLVCAKQVHGGIVRRIRESDSGRGALVYDNSIPDTDAFITDNKNVPLAIFTADCLPVFLYDPKTPAIGLVHAGWRSSKEEIAAKSVQLMREEFNTRAGDLCAYLGPAIRDCCYEVAEEFFGFFSPEHIIYREGRYYLDLAGVNKKQLLSAGVKEENILDHGICTVCRGEGFFSFRKEGGGLRQDDVSNDVKMNRYSLEFILNMQVASVKTLKDSISEFGEGLEILQLPQDNGDKGRDFKICILTEDPTIIFDTCAQFGRLRSVKIDEAMP